MLYSHIQWEHLYEAKQKSVWSVCEPHWMGFQYGSFRRQPWDDLTRAGSSGVNFPGLLSLAMPSELCVVTAGYCPSLHLVARWASPRGQACHLSGPCHVPVPSTEPAGAW